ncbi:gram-negative porin family protein [Ehrlichia chaffeensis str. Heartland]|uniref:Conserved domain protein n=1 Tax=Ehrlichia chaffeensis (strain ATCC CRL-10679 / Arkansas) TaxID=205920 RepID=Q2GGU5_EHRCR|nr:porin [Ehrlichia chaffeensis]ABD45211.1 conserved domain protein [Ehrlichia chaffeensis str. Arkansas]AHX03617.1 gram-negative porin family protein [Ehrlichia chaffeensis str. Heartland]AHX05661.1 gram-negative porin family protein [Ehrlichia chaffeensis str. Jax]AHX06652.1 gram-negative porin family protein [Ehrlichia chaffeensis str. Liberty]AHX07394.1 gram-negative porin family protein [Ehrlichia chaffeensis str. Osceola]
MKNLFVISAFTSLLMMSSYNAFSDEILDGIFGSNNKFINNTKNSFSGINNKALVKGGRIKFAGDMISYTWYSSDDTRNSNKFSRVSKRFDIDTGGNINNVGAKHDGMFSIEIDSNPDKHGIVYGAYSQINIPHVAGKSFGNNAAFNRGSKIFAKTPYGNFSVGYQEGVESMMKLNAFSIVAGDDSNIWTKHLRNILHEKKDGQSGYSVYYFNFNSGLYSESLFRNSDNIVFDDIDYYLGTGIISRSFINNLPFRLSYQSQNFMGLRFGVSYSPFGYDQRLFELQKDRNSDTLILVGPRYRHIVSGGISYTYNIKNLKFSASVIGEYGDEEHDYKAHYNRYYRHNTLKAVSIGWNVGYDKIELAGSYGKLNSAGIPYDKCVIHGVPYEYVYRSVIHWLYLKDMDYYWDIGIAYKYAPLSLSVIYFMSNRVGNELSDVNVGIEYDILKYSGFKSSLFANYNYYTFRQFSDTYRIHVNGKGSILLVGAKLSF